MPKICEKCSKEFPVKLKVDGKVKNLQNRRYCTTCSPLGLHNTRKIIENPLVGLCRYCDREFQYDRSKGHRRTLCGSCAVTRAQRKKKLKAISEFGGKCVKCGYNKCPDALEFHHLRDKAESPAYIIARWSWSRVKKELDKCQLICSNCHREEHYEQDRLRSINGDAVDS